jgi:hypothetical protein
VNARESAALDRWITGDCFPWKRVDHCIARCENGHTWPTLEYHECGTVEYEKPDCPKCGSEFVEVELDDGYED